MVEIPRTKKPLHPTPLGDDPSAAALPPGSGLHERLIGYSVAILGAHTAWANRTLSAREFELVVEVVRRVSSLSEEEASRVTYQAMPRRSQSLLRLSIESLVMALSFEELELLSHGLLEIMQSDGTLCDEERSFIFNLYLEFLAAIGKMGHLTCEPPVVILRALRHLFLPKPYAPQKKAVPKIPVPSKMGTRMRIFDPSGSIVYHSEFSASRSPRVRRESDARRERLANDPETAETEPSEQDT